MGQNSSWEIIVSSVTGLHARLRQNPAITAYVTYDYRREMLIQRIVGRAKLFNADSETKKQDAELAKLGNIWAMAHHYITKK